MITASVVRTKTITTVRSFKTRRKKLRGNMTSALTEASENRGLQWAPVDRDCKSYRYSRGGGISH